ncbi:MAG TPA: hypothetical protein VII92_11815 [Anaerolineae bacterium]
MTNPWKSWFDLIRALERSPVNQFWQAAFDAGVLLELEDETIALDWSDAEMQPKTSNDQGAEPKVHTGSGQSAIVLRSGKPGRKPDKLYNAAMDRIAGGEQLAMTFQWFCTQADIKKPDKSTRDAFKAAIKRRQNIT